jgi:putative DNA primase/helicase
MSGHFPLIPENILGDLKTGRVWVGCDENKAPLIVGKHPPLPFASSTDPRTWRSFEEARLAFERGHCWGIGRVITSPFTGLDFDACRDPETGEISGSVWTILKELYSYTEVSPSLTGVKVWLEAEIAHSETRAGLEIYGGSRYFIVTGMSLSQFPLTPQPRQSQLEALIAKEFPRERSRSGDLMTVRGKHWTLRCF